MVRAIRVHELGGPEAIAPLQRLPSHSGLEMGGCGDWRTQGGGVPREEQSDWCQLVFPQTGIQRRIAFYSWCVMDENGTWEAISFNFLIPVCRYVNR